MHLVLRSSKAKGPMSFRKHHKKIIEILNKFSQKYGVKILSIANVGNHIHMQIKLSNRYTYRPFIRAITSAIAMAVTGINRWTKQEKIGEENLETETSGRSAKEKFWDYRPFTRVVKSYLGFLNLRDYIKINKLEGEGFAREGAEYIVRNFGGLSSA
jgi:REP element-mobilizing transposase RayT